MTVTHINPPTLHGNAAFSQATIVEGGRLLFIGGQNGTDQSGTIYGDAREQCAQALRNVLAILADQGATQSDVAKLSILYTKDASLPELFAASGTVWGQFPTAVTVFQVWSLSRPEALVEIEAVASLDRGDNRGQRSTTR